MLQQQAKEQRNKNVSGSLAQRKSTGGQPNGSMTNFQAYLVNQNYD
jgi:hypothetical protein